MFLLDMRTAIFSFMLVSIVSSIILILLLRQYRTRYKGVYYMLYGFNLQAIAFLLILLRDFVPPWISFVLSNTISFGGIILFYKGMEAYFGLKSSLIPNLILLIVFSAVHSWFTYGDPDLTARNFNLSVIRFIIYLQFVWLLFYRVPRSRRNLTFPLSILSIAYCIVFLVRIIKLSFFGVKSDDIFNSDKFDIVTIFVLQLLMIFLIYALERLFGNQLLEDIKAEEEKFFKAFHTSPYAIVLSRLSDGQIIEINKGFLWKTGYSPSDVYGKTTSELNLWLSDEDRNSVVRELENFGKINQKEILLREKSGGVINGLLTSEIITINNEKCIFSSIDDITERKKNEAELLKSKQLLEKLNQRIIDIRENERREIGLALHDDLGQRLTSLFLDIAWLKGKVGLQPESIRNKFEEIGRMINETIENVKEISAFLRPAILYELGLIPAINSQLKKFEIQSDIKCNFHCERLVNPGDQVSLVLFRVLQESLTNIARHSSASNAEITLRVLNDNLEMKIVDDGIGIPEDKINSLASLGLAGMSERVKGAQGKLVISNNKGSGTTILVTIPFNKNQA